MNNGPWLPEVDLQGLSDYFFDDIVNNIDFPLEDVANGEVEEDWSAGFEGLEPPPMDLFPSLPSDFTGGDISKNARVSGQKAIPILKQDSSSEASLGANSSVDRSSPPDAKFSKHFQSSSPVSVLENNNGGSFASQNPKLLKLTCPVKGMRSKRKRRTNLSLGVFRFPIDPVKSQPFIPEETDSEISYLPEKPAKKKRKNVKTRRTYSGYSDCSEQGVNRKCSHCETTKTPQWREGPNGPKTLCNACGVRFRSGRLLPEYRPASSPTFVPSMHSNSHRKIIEMRRKGDE